MAVARVSIARGGKGKLSDPSLWFRLRKDTVRGVEAVGSASGCGAVFARSFADYSATMDVEAAKKKAAFAAVDEFVKDGQVVGVGSGSTVVYAVERLKERVRAEGIKVTCVATSFQSTQLCVEAGLTLTDLSRDPVLDVVIDGADEVDVQLQLIKGGGGCQLQEKVVASCAKQMVVIADYRKDSNVAARV